MKLPRLDALGASFCDDIVLAPAPGDPNPSLLRGPTAFGDDVPAGRRIAVRLRLTQQAGHAHFDYCDSDPPPTTSPRVRITAAQVQRATLAAVNRVLELPPDSRESQALFSIETDPETWVGADEPSDDDVAVAFGEARVFDAALGAMANAWPSKVGAGSCSLGAVVTLRCGDQTVRDVLQGGEGATPARAGQDAWDGPVLAPTRGSAAWLHTEEAVRERSGGVGARNGGRGLRRSYTVQRDADVTVGIDRITNPPHGIDRAGPPQPAEVWITLPGGQAARVAAWTRHALPAGATLEVLTGGGAGHGFPGWGVDWDPDAF